MMPEHPQFVMSTYANKETLLQEKCAYYMKVTEVLEERVETDALLIKTLEEKIRILLKK